MQATKNVDGTICICMTEEQAKNLLFAAEDMSEVYMEGSEDDPEGSKAIREVSDTLDEIAAELITYFKN